MVATNLPIPEGTNTAQSLPIIFGLNLVGALGILIGLPLTGLSLVRVPGRSRAVGSLLLAGMVGLAAGALLAGLSPDDRLTSTVGALVALAGGHRALRRVHRARPDRVAGGSPPGDPRWPTCPMSGARRGLADGRSARRRDTHRGTARRRRR